MSIVSRRALASAAASSSPASSPAIPEQEKTVINNVPKVIDGVSPSSSSSEPSKALPYFSLPSSAGPSLDDLLKASNAYTPSSPQR